MDRNMNNSVPLTWRLAAKAGTALAVLLALSVPALAVGAVLSKGSDVFSGPAIEAADDRTAHGLRIVNEPQTPPSGLDNRSSPARGADELVLDDWRYTGKPNPSPGH
jgi:hypothetical protein